MNNVIELNQVYKKFKRGRKLLLKEALLDIFKPASMEYFWALRDINLEIKGGETIGIIGSNGSGKSTILKLIAGVMIPDKGTVETKGRIAPLIELGAGFHPELTGRENIFINGVILGLTHSEIEKEYADIVDFAELGDFIDSPIKHYSSGMYMRLAFSIAVHTKPDILLVDEILAVGDENFRKKCLKKMDTFKKDGVTIIYISHDLATVSRFCTRVVLIDNGEVQMMDDPASVIKDFKKRLSSQA